MSNAHDHDDPSVAPSRREQILDATIAVVAEAGYHQASFARIIDHAGLSSTRLISYHFRSREALMQQALARVVARAAAVMGPAIAAEHTIRGKTAAYIRTNLQFLESEPTTAQAALDLARNIELYDEANPAIELLANGFRAGQRSGELRPFDPELMARTLRAAIDACVPDIIAGTRTATHCAAELTTTFDTAIKA